MANTTNFNWETPDDTDLVKDGAAAIRTLGSAIDTSLVDLKGGTTGQVLAKNSNTDMDFVWATDASGIPATIFDAKGDLIVASAADTAARLAVGTNGHILTADSAATNGIKWAAPAGGGKVLQVVSGTYSTEKVISSTTYTDTDLSLSITPSLSTSKVLVMVTQPIRVVKNNIDLGAGVRIMRGSTAVYEPAPGGYQNFYFYFAGASISNSQFDGTITLVYLDDPATTSATTYKTQGRITAATADVKFQFASAVSSIVLMEIGA